jgi:hypothetical protein
MWRAFFLAIGIYACVIGAECMVTERFVMAGERPAPAAGPAGLFGATAFQKPAREVVPPEWAPWSLISAGAVVILYSITLNRQ